MFENLTAEIDDEREDYGERRINVFGYVNGRLFACCYTPRCGWRHIISFRKAHRKEIALCG